MFHSFEQRTRFPAPLHFQHQLVQDSIARENLQGNATCTRFIESHKQGIEETYGFVPTNPFEVKFGYKVHHDMLKFLPGDVVTCHVAKSHPAPLQARRQRC